MNANATSRIDTAAVAPRFLKTSAPGRRRDAGRAVDIARCAHAAGSGGFKIGLIGCGGRGSGAAVNAMNAGPDIKLVAMADIFEDRLQGARQAAEESQAGQVAVDDDHCFIGFDAYQKVIAKRHRRGAHRLRVAFPPAAISRPPSTPASTSSARSPTAWTCRA